MTQINKTQKKNLKQRLTTFVEPDLIKRAKIRGALEGLTLSEVVEKALEVYSPKIENDSNTHIHLKFINGQAIDTSLSGSGREAMKKSDKHTMPLGIPKKSSV